jgi:hypothetical protein
MARWSDAAEEDGEEEVVRRLRRQGNGGAAREARARARRTVVRMERIDREQKVI